MFGNLGFPTMFSMSSFNIMFMLQIWQYRVPNLQHLIRRKQKQILKRTGDSLGLVVTLLLARELRTDKAAWEQQKLNDKNNLFN